MKVKSFFLEGLALAFIVLKLTDQIDWSWWWVLSPIWAPLAAVGVLVLLWCVVVMARKMTGAK